MAIRAIDAGAFATAAGGVVLLAADRGGYFPHTWPWAALAFAAVAAFLLTGTSTPLRTGRTPAVLVAGLAALSAWTALSAIWSSERGTSLQEAVRAPVYTAAALALLAFAGSGSAVALLLGTAVAATGVAGYSLIDFAVHGVHQADQQGALLEYPIGYANGLGILCAIGLVVVLALGIGERKRARGAVVVPSLAAAVVLAVALARTNSVGALAATLAGVAVATAFALGRRVAAVTTAAIAAGLVAAYVLTAITTPGFLRARGDYWHVAWIGAAHHPLAGDGAGTYDLAWATHGNVARFGGALDAHSLYLEMPAELGLIGLLFTCVLLVPAVSGIRRAPRTPAAAAALGGSVAFLVHAGLDWDWELPAVTVSGLACLAALWGTAADGAPIGARTRSAGLVVAVATVVAYVVFLAAG